MAFWTTDLTTHDGAIGAAEMGGTSCFVAAGLSVVGLALTLVYVSTGAVGAVGLAIVAVEVTAFIVAGSRLRAGNGAVWGMIAALLLVIEIGGKLASMTGLIGMMIDSVLLVGVVNGVRAAFALKRGIHDPDQVAETFR